MNLKSTLVIGIFLGGASFAQAGDKLFGDGTLPEFLDHYEPSKKPARPLVNQTVLKSIPMVTEKSPKKRVKKLVTQSALPSKTSALRSSQRSLVTMDASPSKNLPQFLTSKMLLKR